MLAEVRAGQQRQPSASPFEGEPLVVRAKGRISAFQRGSPNRPSCLNRENWRVHLLAAARPWPLWIGLGAQWEVVLVVQ